MSRTQPSPGTGTPLFAELMTEVMTSTGRFGHREHIALAWLAVRRCGMPAAIGLVGDGIRHTARYLGAPQKYHATVSRAWVELVAYHVAEADDGDFAAFAARNPALFGKRLLTRFYRSATLAGRPARTGWVEPDLAPFPQAWAKRHGNRSVRPPRGRPRASGGTKACRRASQKPKTPADCALATQRLE